jgi:hypothetical protein
MCTRLRWLALALFLTLIAAAPTLAAPDSATPAIQPSLGLTLSVLPDSLRPATTSTVDTSLTRLQPVQVAHVPSYSITTPTFLSAGTQPIGFQGSRANGANNRHVRWAIYGAAIGLAVGLIDGNDEVRDTLLGAGIGLGLSFVIAR